MIRRLRCSSGSLLSFALIGLGGSGCYVGYDEGDTYTSSTGGLSEGSDGEDDPTGDDSDDSDGSTGSESGTGGITATESSTGSTSDDGTTGAGTTGDGTSATDGTSTGGTTDATTTTDGTSTSTTGMTTGSSSGSTGGSTSTGGMGEYCDADDDWMGSWSTLEEEVVTIVNQKRSQGANCGSEGSFGAAGPLTMDPLLRCAARLHSKDMVVNNFFNHTNLDNESPWDRIAKTGYGGYSNAGENIAAGSGTASGVVDQWMNSDGHCANIMKSDFNEIGVGYYPGGQYGHVWTQVFTKK